MSSHLIDTTIKLDAERRRAVCTWSARFFAVPSFVALTACENVVIPSGTPEETERYVDGPVRFYRSVYTSSGVELQPRTVRTLCT